MLFWKILLPYLIYYRTTDQLLMYRSIFDEWKKWAKKQDQKFFDAVSWE